MIKRENMCCNGKQSIDSSQIHPITACAQTCRSPHPSMIEKGGINEQTRLAVVINVQMPVFLTGHLIRSLVVAAGLAIPPHYCPTMPKPLLLAPAAHHPPTLTQTCPWCLIWHLCLEVLWWNAALPAMPLQVLPAGHHPFWMQAAAAAAAAVGWPVVWGLCGEVAGVWEVGQVDWRACWQFLVLKRVCCDLISMGQGHTL